MNVVDFLKIEENSKFPTPSIFVRGVKCEVDSQVEKVTQEWTVSECRGFSRSMGSSGFRLRHWFSGAAGVVVNGVGRWCQVLHWSFLKIKYYN